MIENARANPDLTVDVAAAHELWKNKDALVIDVRTHDEYRAAHIQGAINIPLAELPDRAAELPEDHNTPVLTVCQRGNISLPGVLFLNSLGYREARSITGGTSAWQDLGYATESP